jgi:hypothetical protein
MSVEIVQHQAYLGGITILGRKRLTKQREFALGAPLVHLPKPSSREWFNRSEQRTRTKLVILVMLFSNLAFAHWSRQQCIANQETRSFIEAYHRIARIVGLGIQPQDVFKLCEKGSIDGANAPGLF